MATWKQPQGLRLAERLRAVADGLRDAAPLLVEAQVKAFESMAAAVEASARSRAQELHHGLRADLPGAELSAIGVGRGDLSSAGDL